MIRDPKVSRVIYGVITNDVSDYVNLLVRIAHINCNHPLYRKGGGAV
jgi:hypothetical protein